MINSVMPAAGSVMVLSFPLGNLSGISAVTTCKNICQGVGVVAFNAALPACGAKINGYFKTVLLAVNAVYFF